MHSDRHFKSLQMDFLVICKSEIYNDFRDTSLFITAYPAVKCKTLISVIRPITIRRNWTLLILLDFNFYDPIFIICIARDRLFIVIIESRKRENLCAAADNIIEIHNTYHIGMWYGGGM